MITFVSLESLSSLSGKANSTTTGITPITIATENPITALKQGCDLTQLKHLSPFSNMVGIVFQAGGQIYSNGYGVSVLRTYPKRSGNKCVQLRTKRCHLIHC